MLAALQLQRVKNVGTAEGLVHYLRLHAAAVIVDDVVRAQEHFDAADLAAGAAAFAAFQRQRRMQAAEFDFHLVLADDLARQENALADKVSDEAVGRLVVEVVGRIPLLDAAPVHDADLVGHGEGFVLIVSDQNGSHAFALEDFANFKRQAFAQVDVEVRERFIKQDQFGFRGQCARQCHALLLATGELVRVLFTLTGEADGFKQLRNTYGPFGVARGAKAESDIAGDGEMREKRVILKDHADPPLFRRQRVAGSADGLPFQPDFTGGYRLEAGDAAQQRGLAATRRTEQAGDAAGIDPERDAVDDKMLAVALLDVFEFEMGHGGGRCLYGSMVPAECRVGSVRHRGNNTRSIIIRIHTGSP